MMPDKKRMPLTVLLVVLAFTIACGSGSDEVATDSDGKAKLDIGIAISSYVHAVAWVANDKDLFEQAQIEPNIQVMSGSSSTMQGLLSNNLDIGIAGGDSMVKANLAGGDLVVIAGLVNRFYHRLISRAGGPRLEELDGEIIGLPFLGGPQDTAVKYALETAGLSYENDVDVRTMGADFNRLVALSRGDIDITTASLPPARLAELDLEVVADLPAWDVEFPYAAVIVRRSFLEANRPAVRNFLRAYCGGVRYYKDDANREENLQLLAQRFGTSTDDPQNIDSYENRGPDFIASPPFPSVEAFATVLDFMDDPEAAGLAPDEYFELGLLEELERSGQC